MKQLAIACLAMLAGLALQKAAAAEPPSKLMVVAPENFHAELKEFIAHKQKLLRTELVALEQILKNSKGVDDPEKLKRYLYEQWRGSGLKYALLVGDVDVLPVRFMVLDRVTPAAFDYAFYPSDLYYSDLAKADGSFDDWNGRKESFHAGYFGEVRGEKNKGGGINYDQIDYLPEICVGRWPVSTPAEAKLIAEKTIRFEQNVLTNTSAEIPRAAFVAVGGWVDSRDQMDQWAGKFKDWRIVKRYYADKRRASSELPDRNRVRELLNSGASLVVHTGHGQANAWEQCLSVRDLGAITNGSRLPVIISAGCSTAYFAPLPPYEAYVDVAGKEHAGSDHKEVFTEPPPPPAPYQRGRFNGTGLGEQLLKRSEHGAVAYIGCNTGSQPCGLSLVEGFVGSWSSSDKPTLGECWAEAIRYYYKKERLAELKPDSGWYPPSIFFQGMKFMLFGDPSLRLPGNGQ